jgi:hypothetical protein
VRMRPEFSGQQAGLFPVKLTLTFRAPSRAEGDTRGGLALTLPAQPLVSRVLTLHSAYFRIVTNGMSSVR